MLVNGQVPRGNPREGEAIHGAMIMAAIRDEEQATHTREHIDYSQWQPTPMQSVESLRLSFKGAEIAPHLALSLQTTLAPAGIHQMANLDVMTRLTTLCLDNNGITTIQGLDALVNLRWLGTIDSLTPPCRTSTLQSTCRSVLQ